jgi:hypothetical protein
MGMGIEKAGGDPLATGIDDPLGQCRVEWLDADQDDAPVVDYQAANG